MSLAEDTNSLALQAPIPITSSAVRMSPTAHDPDDDASAATNEEALLASPPACLAPQNPQKPLQMYSPVGDQKPSWHTWSS